MDSGGVYTWCEVFVFLVSVVGIVLAVEQAPAIGIIFLLVGGIATYAGMAGTLYEVIADGVAKGYEIATGPIALKVGGSTDDEEPVVATKVEEND